VEQARRWASAELPMVGLKNFDWDPELLRQWRIKATYSLPEIVAAVCEMEKKRGKGRPMAQKTLQWIERLRIERRAGRGYLRLAAEFRPDLSKKSAQDELCGEVGLSGRSSIQLSGLVDVIVHLVRSGDSPRQRKLELVGRVPGLPAEQTIELLPSGDYVNFGEPALAKSKKEAAAFDAIVRDEPRLSLRIIAERMGIGVNRVKQVGESAGWSKDDESGLWTKHNS
jgi:hypothetical protein